MSGGRTYNQLLAVGNLLLDDLLARSESGVGGRVQLCGRLEDADFGSVKLAAAKLVSLGQKRLARLGHVQHQR